MRRLLDFYATQVRVLWEWQGGPISLLKRLIITLIVATVSFLGTVWILSPRMTVDDARRRRARGHPHGPVQRRRSAQSCSPWRRRSHWS